MTQLPDSMVHPCRVRHCRAEAGQPCRTASGHEADRVHHGRRFYGDLAHGDALAEFRGLAEDRRKAVIEERAANHQWLISGRETN